jgi:photosystem II protein PsbQ
MKRYRSILACVLALVTAFVVGCGAPQVAEPPTYSSAQLEQIQDYQSTILGLRDRMTKELSSSIQKGDWVNVDNFVHGPLGTLLLDMNYLVGNLLPDDQPQARKLAREVFQHLVEVTKAAKNGDRAKATASYQKALDDLDTFLTKVPQA